MKRTVQMVLRLIAAGLILIGGLNVGLEFERHWLRHATLNLRLCLLWAIPVVLGLAAAGAYAVGAGLITTGHMVPTWVLQAAILTTFTYAYVAAGDELGRG